MKKSVFRLLLLAAVALPLSCTPSYAVRERPQEVVYLRPAPPGPDYVWVTGDWVWAGKKYEWHEGRYEKRRKSDNGNMVLMTDGLTRLFSNSIRPIESARRFGLGAVQHLPPLKRFFMRTAMGLKAKSA